MATTAILLAQLIANLETERQTLDDLITSLRKGVTKLRLDGPNLDSLRQEATARYTLFKRIVDFFMSQNNQPISLRDLATSLGVNSNSVANVLYQTHPNSFISQPVPGFRRQVVWSVRAEVLEQHRPSVT